MSESLSLIFLLPIISLILFIVAFQRGRQSIEDKVSKAITGMSYRNPKMYQRVIEDKKIVRAKYNLPPSRLLSEEPREYIRKIENLAAENGMRIENLNRNNYGIGGMASSGDERVIRMTPYKIKDKDSLIKYGRTLTHELVHMFQHEKYPQMPVERREYEAYLVSGTDDPARLKKQDVRQSLFSLIDMSAQWWHKHHQQTKKD